VECGTVKVFCSTKNTLRCKPTTLGGTYAPGLGNHNNTFLLGKLGILGWCGPLHCDRPEPYTTRLEYKIGFLRLDFYCFAKRDQVGAGNKGGSFEQQQGWISACDALSNIILA